VRVYRDLEALQIAGFPIYTEKVEGRNLWYGHLVPGSNRCAVDKLDDATVRNLYATTDEKGVGQNG